MLFGTAPDSHTLGHKSCSNSGLNFSGVSCFLFLKAQAGVITALKQCLLESNVLLSWRLILCLFTNRHFIIKAHHTLCHSNLISVQPHALPSLVHTYKLALCNPMSIYYAFAFKKNVFLHPTMQHNPFTPSSDYHVTVQRPAVNNHVNMLFTWTASYPRTRVRINGSFSQPDSQIRVLHVGWSGNGNTC